MFNGGGAGRIFPSRPSRPKLCLQKDQTWLQSDHGESNRRVCDEGVCDRRVCDEGVCDRGVCDGGCVTRECVMGECVMGECGSSQYA